MMSLSQQDVAMACPVFVFSRFSMRWRSSDAWLDYFHLRIMPTVREKVRWRLLATVSFLAAFLQMPAISHAGSYDDFFKAVRLDNVLIIKPMLQRGLDPNLVEPERGDTGLILAVREESMQVFRLLLDAPAIKLDARSRNGDTALMIASFKKNRAAVEGLLAKGAEVNRPGWTALHYAAAAGANDIVQLLLDHSAYLDAESPNKTTPLMMAARSGHIYTVKLLHDSGADATLKNDLGMTAMDFARQNGHAAIAEGLEWRIKRQAQREREAAQKKTAEAVKFRAVLFQRHDVSAACLSAGSGSPSVFLQASGRSEALSEGSPGNRD